MKIVQLNCVYKNGSTGKLVQNLHLSYLDKGYDSYVLYGRGKKEREKHVYKVSSEFEAKIHGFLSRMLGMDFNYSYFATKRTISLIKKIKPDIVHLHCLNGHFINVYRLLNFLKKKKLLFQ